MMAGFASIPDLISL
ncbi:hypothetical protein [Streptococcus equi]